MVKKFNLEVSMQGSDSFTLRFLSKCDFCFLLCAAVWCILIAEVNLKVWIFP